MLEFTIVYMFINMFETLLNVGNKEYLSNFSKCSFLKSSSVKMILCYSSDQEWVFDTLTSAE